MIILFSFSVNEKMIYLHRMTRGCNNSSQSFILLPLINNNKDKRHLTLFAAGLKIYIKWRGGEGIQHHLLQNTENHCDKTNFLLIFRKWTCHTKIGKVTKFGGVWRPFWESWLIYGKGWY